MHGGAIINNKTAYLFIFLESVDDLRAPKEDVNVVNDRL